MDITTTRPRDRCLRRPGFTLVEILIVVVILSILAALVVPKFVSAAGESRENSIKANLWRMRTQLELYKQEHDGYPSLANFEDQMTLASKADGSTAAIGTSGYPFGPYLPKIANNSETGTNTVTNGAVGTSAWYYDETPGDLLANHSAPARAW